MVLTCFRYFNLVKTTDSKIRHSEDEGTSANGAALAVVFVSPSKAPVLVIADAKKVEKVCYKEVGSREVVRRAGSTGRDIRKRLQNETKEVLSSLPTVSGTIL